MTVIAWDGKTLAADRQSSDSCGMKRMLTKIERHGNALLGITGGYGTGAELREWWKAGADPDKFPAKARDDVSTLIVVTAKGVCFYSSSPYPVPIGDHRCAFGSGRDFAEMAMYLGKTAQEAVECACVFQIDYGNGVDALTLEGE